MRAAPPPATFSDAPAFPPLEGELADSFNDGERRAGTADEEEDGAAGPVEAVVVLAVFAFVAAVRDFAEGESAFSGATGAVVAVVVALAAVLVSPAEEVPADDVDGGLSC